MVRDTLGNRTQLASEAYTMSTAATTARPELYAGMPQGWTVQDSLADNWGAGNQNLVAGAGTAGSLTSGNKSGFIAQTRSEERRVGKEWRSGLSARPGE